MLNIHTTHTTLAVHLMFQEGELNFKVSNYLPPTEDIFIRCVMGLFDLFLGSLMGVSAHSPDNFYPAKRDAVAA